MNEPDLVYRIALTLLPQIGPVTGKKLISYCGGVREIFETPQKQLSKIPGIGPALIKQLNLKTVLTLAEKELKLIKEHKIRCLFFLDKDYPKRLMHIPDSPIMLYLKGNAEMNAIRTLGIVGTRKPTFEGINQTEKLIEELKDYNIQIISGLAYGVDITAHKRSLEMGISNIAILGHGLSRVYPAVHTSVARAIEKCGGLLSEFPYYTEPDRERFPMRNRIIAGLSDALVVIETPKSGGSMITADMAFNYNKDVFAFPGRPQDVVSKGCNFLIKQNKAGLIENGKDLVEQMMWDQLDKSQDIQTTLFVDLDSNEIQIMDHIKQNSKPSIDELAFNIKTSQSEMASLLLGLEFKGLIKSLPGKRFMLS